MAYRRDDEEFVSDEVKKLMNSFSMPGDEEIIRRELEHEKRRAAWEAGMKQEAKPSLKDFFAKKNWKVAPPYPLAAPAAPTHYSFDEIGKVPAHMPRPEDWLDMFKTTGIAPVVSAPTVAPAAERKQDIVEIAHEKVKSELGITLAGHPLFLKLATQFRKFNESYEDINPGYKLTCEVEYIGVTASLKDYHLNLELNIFLEGGLQKKKIFFLNKPFQVGTIIANNTTGMVSELISEVMIELVPNGLMGLISNGDSL